MGYQKALALGFELSSFMIVSYLVHDSVAEYMGWDVNLTLSLLLGLSLVVWTLHAFLYVQSEPE